MALNPNAVDKRLALENGDDAQVTLRCTAPESFTIP
jgi:hypothetical protein